MTGLNVQACGDAHVNNFGQWATPERNIIFGINDFDETIPAPFEWDVKRLAASLEVAMRANGVPKKLRFDAVASAVRVYRERMAGFSQMRVLEVWYSRIDVNDMVRFFPNQTRPEVRRNLQKAKRKTHLRAMNKLTEVVDGHRRFVDDPPFIVHLEETGNDMDDVMGLVEGYRASLADDMRNLFDRYELVDVARKVVGVGSVGTRTWVGLLEGPDHPAGDPLFLQVKEATASALEPYVGASELSHHGLRVVSGQRLTQAASDIFLGWSEGPKTGRQYYVRQLWDIKGGGDPGDMDYQHLAYYGRLCAWALARAHAKTGDPVLMSGYLGRSRAFDEAIARFAQRYAEQNESDYAALLTAINDGVLETAT